MNLRLLPLAIVFTSLSAADVEWREYLGGPERSHYSTLTQINPGNVAQLRVAWEFHTGEPGEMQCNPIVIDGVLFGSTAMNSVFALDAATGHELWRFTPSGPRASRSIRGVAYWANGDDRRILFCADSWLHAVDARTGKLIATFGTEGRTSLKSGLGETAKDKFVISSTPGTVFEDLIFMPLRLQENAEAALGSIQAFNVRTGQLAWVFRTIPAPGEAGYETWPKEAYLNTNVGSANNWAGMAIDRARGILYVPTGSAAPDFWGGDRHGANLYANCLLALDARTGRRLWHFQLVHHDLWDRDLPAPPNLLTVVRDGKKIDAVAQVTKSGHVFVFDRVTGTPLFPIKEVPVPRSELAGEESWPTQPRPEKPAAFARQTLTEDDINPYSEDHDALLAKFRAARHGTFQPFGLYDTVLLPGFDGGAEWGGAATDPAGVLYVNANQMAWMARLKGGPHPDDLARLSPGARTYAIICAACHGAERQGNPAANLPPLVKVGARKTREEVAQLITTGKGMMPGQPAIPAADKQALIDFLFDAEKTNPAANANPGRKAGSAKTAKTAAANSPYRLDGYVRWVDRRGYHAIRPPWGTLTAIDLNNGEQRWQIPLGEFKALTAEGIPPTGAENYGGPVVTASGLLFIAATKDGGFRVFESKTGKLLWETQLPAAGFATPTTYSVGGKQFVVVAAGGTKLSTPKGDSYVAFALP